MRLWRLLACALVSGIDAIVAIRGHWVALQEFHICF